MYNDKKVSVVFATYKEKDSIRAVIENFFDTGFVDEIIVVNNNAEPGTVEEVQKTKARIVYEKRQGYGYTYQTGVKEASGDYVILCEPDGTYVGSDIERFLVYAKTGGFDVVLGSRTGLTKPMGGSMGFLRKYANVFEGKTIELLFNTNALSDVGCTYKLFTRKAIDKLSPLWRTKGGLFATELVLLTITENLRFVEIPITFKERVGVSVMVNSIRKLIKWGLLIYAFIFYSWFRWIFRKVFGNQLTKNHDQRPIR